MDAVINPQIDECSRPHLKETWPAIGQISRDQVATMGIGGFAFLYQGSNRYYDAYSHPKSLRQAKEWAELTDERHRRFARSSVPFISAFVPNKATILGDRYPFLLPNTQTPTLQALSTALAANQSVKFLDSQHPVISGRTWAPETLWRRVDSHWSVFGCIAAVNVTLEGFGIAPLEPPIIDSDLTLWGDLSSRWLGPSIQEEQYLYVPTTQEQLGLPDPTLEFDSADGVHAGGVTGRRVVWVNEEAPYPAHLTVVGNSFAGAGQKPDQMVWWFSRLFKRVTFIHSGGIPNDLLDALHPDAVLFQGLERFLHVVPRDDFTMDELEEVLAREALASHG